MQSLVRELQAKAIDRNTSVSDLLRLAKVVAVKLDLTEFQQWIDSEMNGYAGSPVPAYRKVRGQMRAVNPFRGLIPVVFPDDDLAKSATERHLTQRIAEVENLVFQGSGNLTMPLADGMQSLLQRLFREQMEFKLTVPPVLLVGVIDAVRNVILDWSLTLEKDGILGEGMSFSKEDRERAQDQVATFRIDRIENFTGHLGNMSGGQVNATTHLNPARVSELSGEIAKNIDGFGLSVENKAVVLGITDQLNEAGNPDTRVASTLGLLKQLKGTFENAAGGLLAAGVIHELSKLIGS